MKDQRRPIFRDKAVRSYLEDRKAAVLPRFVSPSKLKLLWVLLGSFVAVVAGGLFFGGVPLGAPEPDGTSGQGVGGGRPSVEVVVSVSERTAGNLRMGQKLTLTSDRNDGAMEASIVAVEPADPGAAGSPTAARPQAVRGHPGASPDGGDPTDAEATTPETRPSASLLPPGQGFRGTR